MRRYIVRNVFGAACLCAAAMAGCSGGGAGTNGGGAAAAQALPAIGGRSSHAAVAGSSHVRRMITPPSCFGTPGPNSVVAGGDSNVASGGDSGVLGGISNQVCNNISSIVGGIDNSISDSTDSANRSFIGGGQNNVITGGGIWAFIGGGDENTMTGQFGFLGGGENNTDAGNFGSVAGGDLNNIAVAGNYSSIGGGASNTASNQYGTIAGGDQNGLSGEFGAIAGGFNNRETGEFGSVGGGESNRAAGSRSTVPGGEGNVATGTGSFAGGIGSNAAYDGDFVWSDASSGAKAIKATAANELLVRASGGVTFYSSGSLASGVHLAAGSGTWSSLSDRNAKTGILPVRDDDILAKVTSLPISEWSYATERGVRHVGPMAQDFYAAFGVGEDDRHITSIDEDGVALAAIKALHRENQELKADLRRTTVRENAELTELRREMQALEADVSTRRGETQESRVPR